MTATAKAIEKAAKTKRGTTSRSPTLTISNSFIGAVFVPRARSEVWSIQEIHAPFDQLDDGNSYRDGESKKENELDDHFSDP
jgi:hypothetical protein